MILKGLTLKRIFILSQVILIFVGCATYKEQYNRQAVSQKDSNSKIEETMFLVGGLGNNPNPEFLNQISEELKNNSSNSTLILLGDNVNFTNNNTDTKQGLSALEKLIGSFEGRIVFVPGDLEWSKNSESHLERIEKYLQKEISTNKIFLPKKTCPLEQVTINDNLDLILIDSQWYLQDWDRIKGINVNCTDIKTRRRFVEELEGMLRDSRGKNTVIAMHHPIFSNGEYGGQKGFLAHNLPVPIVGSLGYVMQQLAGSDPKSTGFKRYRSLMIQVSSLAQRFERVTIVSGHEKSLQLLKSNKVNQIISGALGETSRTNKGYGNVSAIGGRLEYEGIYTSGQQGYAKLIYYKDGSSKVFFYQKNDIQNNLSFDIEKQFGKTKPFNVTTKTIPSTTKATILKPKDTIRSGFYKFMWGKNHRNVYAKPITASNAILDTLYGGLRIMKEGGGHQSQSLRLTDINGRQYAMRKLQKEGLRFLQFQIKGIAYNPESYEDTGVEKFVTDFFTTSHPYMQLTIPAMAKAVNINHADTKLYYIPEQKVLGNLNPEYANALYYIEQRPSDEQKDYIGYNRNTNYNQHPITDFESTTDMLEKLRSDEKYSIDQRAYIRARIFDMLIGDWDRHEDQWRWIEYTISDDKKVFVPVPRDRDGAFGKYEGLGIDFVQLIMPETRFWQTYDDHIKSIKWFNGEVFNLDKTLLREFDLTVWKKEAKTIQQGLTDEVLDQAFQNLPFEIRNETKDYYKPIIKKRLAKLQEFAEEYARFLTKTVVLHATDKDDRIIVNRNENGTTTIEMFRKKSEESNPPFFTNTYDPDLVSEIWVYGLNDQDTFVVNGSKKAKIMIRLIGGHGEDSFMTTTKRKLKIYDFKHENNNFNGSTSPRRQLSEQYEVNNFHYRYFLKSNNIISPIVGFGNDKGLFAGISNVYTKNGFNGNPYRQQHALSANYYFNLSAVELHLSSDFANIIPDVNIDIEGYFTSQGFARNFFGLGNDSINQEDDIDREFNQVETQQIQIFPSLKYKIFKIGPEFESYKVEQNLSRISTTENLNPEVFESQQYIGAKASLKYQNVNSFGYPTKGFYFQLTGGWKTNIDNSDNNFGFIEASLGIDQNLIRNENLVLSTKIGGKSNIGNNFFFYHAASLGQNNGLRGFRNNRFAGKHFFYHTSDLKLRIKQFNTSMMPITFGIYGGFDYGRVWLENDDSNTWHHGEGGGLWFGGLNALSLKLGYFRSDDDAMLNIKLGFGF